MKDKHNIPDTDDGKFILSSNMEYITGYLMQRGSLASDRGTKDASKEKTKTVSPEDIEVRIEIRSGRER